MSQFMFVCEKQCKEENARKVMGPGGIDGLHYDD